MIHDMAILNSAVCGRWNTETTPGPLLYAWFFPRRSRYPRPGTYTNVTWCPRYGYSSCGRTNFDGEGIIFGLPRRSTDHSVQMDSPRLFHIRFALFRHLSLQLRSLREFAVCLPSGATIIEILLAHRVEHRAELRCAYINNRELMIMRMPYRASMDPRQSLVSYILSM